MVYYPKAENVVGGNFEIYPYDERAGIDGVRSYLERGIEESYKEIIRCVQNRMVLYDSARLHRVSVVHKGVRENLASSIWFEKPMIPDFVQRCQVLFLIYVPYLNGFSPIIKLSLSIHFSANNLRP